MKSKYLIAAFAITTLTANAATIYTQDFQAIANGTNNPDGWTGPVRAFSGAGATSETNNDRALIRQSNTNAYETLKDIGIAVTANTTYTLNLDGGLYASGTGPSASLEWELGSYDGVTFTAFSTANSTSITNAITSGSFFGAGNDQALTEYTFTTGAIVSDNIAIRLAVTNNNNNFGGFDGIVVDAVPEPSSSALLGLAGISLILRRRK